MAFECTLVGCPSRRDALADARSAQIQLDEAILQVALLEESQMEAVAGVAEALHEYEVYQAAADQPAPVVQDEEPRQPLAAGAITGGVRTSDHPKPRHH